MLTTRRSGRYQNIYEEWLSATKSHFLEVRALHLLACFCCPWTLRSARNCCLAHVNAGNRETEVKVALLTCVHLLNKKPETLWIQVPNGSVPKAATGIWALANSWPVGLPKLTLAFPVDSKEKDILREEPCQSLSITEIRWLNYIMQQANQPNRHIGFVSPDLNQQNHIIFHGLRQSPTPGVASAAHEALAPDRNTTNTWFHGSKISNVQRKHTHIPIHTLQLALQHSCWSSCWSSVRSPICAMSDQPGPVA